MTTTDESADEGVSVHVTDRTGVNEERVEVSEEVRVTNNKIIVAPKSVHQQQATKQAKKSGTRRMNKISNVDGTESAIKKNRRADNLKAKLRDHQVPNE